jgi:uroporphyrinogen decarboxylase
MRPKKRVLLAMDHREPDRVPLDYGAQQPVTERLCRHLGIDPTCSPDHFQHFPEALLQRLHVDLRTVRAQYIGPPLPVDPHGGSYDVFGVRIAPEGYPVGYPLAQATTVAEIDAYAWPDPDAYDYEHYGEQCQAVGDYAVCGGNWSPFFTWGLEMMGTERFLMSMRTRPELIHALLGHMVDFYYETSRRMFAAAKGHLDIFFMGDDYGTQIGPFMSPRDFRTFIVPHLERLYGLAKSHGLKVMQHSCGSVRAVLPDLIAAGMDALDPVQVRAQGMEIEGLKRDFPGITLHGSIDTQHTLPMGTPEDVRQEVLDRLTRIAPGGGLILCGSQDYITDIPSENIVTIYDTVCEYGHYGRLGRSSK